MRLGRFTSITEVYNWIEQYFNQYNQNIQQILQNYQLYQTDLTEVTQILKQSVSFIETFYPDKHTEVTSVDGEVRRTATDPHSWANVHDGAGTAHWDESSNLVAMINSSNGVNTWAFLSRVIILFNTSLLPSNALITWAKVVLRLYSIGKVAGWSCAYVVVSSNPASDVDLVNADYGTLGSTPLSQIMGESNFVAGYDVEFLLNAAGLAAINKDGITKLGIREYNYDCLNVAPGWQLLKVANLTTYSSDTGSGTTRPRLIVGYIVP